MWKRYLIFWIILFVLFASVQDAGYVTDFLGWQIRVTEGGFLGALHTYDYPAQLQGYALLMWLIEHLRGISTWLVHAFNVTLFAGSATLIYKLVKNLLNDFNLENTELGGLVAAILFIASPTNSEIMIWRVCPHYLVSILVWVGSLLLLRIYLIKGKKNNLSWALALQTTGLFSLELAYALPIAVFGWIGFYFYFLQKGTWQRGVVAVGSAVVLVALHLLLTKLVQGAWIGHYGAEVATSQPLSEIIAAPWRWMARTILHYRFWPNKAQYWLTGALGSPIVSLGLYSLTGLLLARATAAAYRTRKIFKTVPTWTALLLWIFLAGAGAAAVSQLYFYDLLLVDTDRLGALVVVFTSAFLGTLISLFPKRWGILISIPLVLVSGFYQSKTISSWASSQQILNGLSSSFSEVLAKAEQDNEKINSVYLLGYARTFNGVHLVGDNREGYSALESHLASSVSGHAQGAQQGLDIIDISQFHQLSLTDTMNAKWVDETLYVSLAAPGSWMMHKDLGIKNRRDEEHAFDLAVEQYRIRITWDTLPPKSTMFLYQKADHFCRLAYPAPVHKRDQ